VRLRFVIVLACVAAVAAPAAGIAGQGPQGRAERGRFLVWYAKPRNSDERLLVGLIKASKLGEVMTSLGQSLIIPRNVTIAVKGGQSGPFYNPDTHIIVLHHPFLELGAKVYSAEYPKISDYELGKALASLEYFVLFHEIGHALVDLWNIPVLGREEDAVDGFSTIFMTEFVPDGGQIALWGADFFDYLGRHEGRFGRSDFADEHSLDPQRAYSIACWVYGSNPKKYGGLADVIPHERLVRCPAEYRKLRKAWFQFLRPHISR
jgi:Putative metallopeptidase